MSSVLSIALAALITAPAPPADPAKEAQDSVQGEWKFVSFTKLGRDNPDLVKTGRVVIADNKLTIRSGDRDSAMTFTLDPKADRPAIDMKGPGSEKTIRGIYKLEKDKLTICFGIENSPRPTEFKSGGNDSLMVLERVKK